MPARRTSPHGSLRVSDRHDPSEIEARTSAPQLAAGDLRLAAPGRIGSQLGAPRLHADSEAASHAQRIGALAFTVGRDIYFGAGQYSPSTPAGRELIAHELVHVDQQSRAGLRLDRAEDPAAAEHAFWLSEGKQPNYGVLPVDRRTPMKLIGNQVADERLWSIEATVTRQLAIADFLQQHFGPDKRVRVTSVVKDGEHRTYRKMDVVPAGTTSWEELAAAAVHAGFWVHAEGVTLDGKLWPLSPLATGSHLDLYLIRQSAGDFPSEGGPAPSGHAVGAEASPGPQVAT